MADVADAAVTTVAGGAVTNVDITTFRNATMSGTVTDATGTALEGAYVSVCDVEQAHCSSATTDPDGAYTTGGLPPNDYTVQVGDADGSHPVGYLAPGNGFTPLPDEAVKIPVGDADETGVDVQIPTASGSAEPSSPTDCPATAGSSRSACPRTCASRVRPRTSMARS